MAYYAKIHVIVLFASVDFLCPLSKIVHDNPDALTDHSEIDQWFYLVPGPAGQASANSGHVDGGTHWYLPSLSKPCLSLSSPFVIPAFIMFPYPSSGRKHANAEAD